MGHCTVNDYRVSFDIAENPLVCCGRAPTVMLRLQPVNRHYNVEPGYSGPFDRYRADSTGDKLNLDAHAIQFRQKHVKLSKPNQRLSANYGHMNWVISSHKIQHTIYERGAFVIS